MDTSIFKGSVTEPEGLTKARLLDVAERLFADHGIDGASLRQITKEAGVNLGAVNYHFRTKEGLMVTVFNRRFGPLKQEQLNLLKQAEQQAGEGASTVEKVLEALLMPALRLAKAADTERQIAMKLIGRIVTEPNPRIQDLLCSQQAEVRTAFTDALRRSLPQLSSADLTWRLELLWGALAFVLCNPGGMERATGGVCNPADTQAVLAQMIAFFSAGLRAPSVT